ncbi:MAG: HAMP domain-containing histidine kinase, partial [Butyrivibrio sp.]|nr:HAMP domain-containing histidine kinase [Butyrivibrio sp.]
MSKEQKISLLSACVFYVLTIIGFFFFSVTLIVLLFLGFTLSISYFGYLCYKAHNDYTGAEHLQQEIGVLNAEKVQLKNDYETLIKEKDEELEQRQLRIDRLGDDLQLLTMKKNEVQAKADELSLKLESSDEYEGLLPPEENDDAANVDILEIARKAIEELSDAAKKAGLRISISSASDKLMVHASEKRLLIMFRNIIDNSIKYMQTEGSLVITISAIEDDIFIVLKDTGKGLDESETKHIFELNY